MLWNRFKKKDKEVRDAQKEVPLPAQQARDAHARPRPRARATFPESAQNIFVRPLSTEKSLFLARHDVYAFEVRRTATKITIKKAFANLYGTMPTGVRVAHQQGKAVRSGRREGRRKDWKKAFITVPKGTTIDIQ